MNAERLAALLHQHQRAVSMTEPMRYSCTIPAIEASENIFGMNFEKIFSLPLEQQSAYFLRQQAEAAILRRLLCGEKVSDEQLQMYFGFGWTELSHCMQTLQPVRKPIPERLVVLCFDDAIRDQYELAVPELTRHGFHATFFIAELPDSPRGTGFSDKTRYMTWEQIKELEQMGFELGNHTRNHLWGLQDMGKEKFLEEVKALEADFESHDLCKPVSFAYPSGIANSEAVSYLRSCGYRWGRGNCETGPCGMRGMSYYVPACDSPLAMPNFGDPDYYSEELLRTRISGAAEGRVLGLTYHSVSPENWAGSCSFRRQMELLAEENCTVISVREMEQYVDPLAADRCNPV